MHAEVLTVVGGEHVAGGPLGRGCPCATVAQLALQQGRLVRLGVAPPCR